MGLYGCFDRVEGEIVLEFPPPSQKLIIRIGRLRYVDQNGVVDSGPIEWTPNSGGYILERIAQHAALRIKKVYGLEVPSHLISSEYALTGMTLEEVMLDMLAEMVHECHE
jgi:hypothetical protein